ncbi:right-handed parallel beta-helix repeat-containing protein, partial [Candidatus Woesearchaeota archaeon]|nr:right-handed parallel beta-helix repeat-containing protein [Candidatus Woesearchaeota archaeon]
YDASDNSVICTNTSISNGSDVICNWTGLSTDDYYWYVNVTDGTDTTQSPSWDFIILSYFCSSNVSSDYTMNSSIYCNKTAVYIVDNNIDFNCNNNSIIFVGSNNTGEYAFNMSLVDNITIQNCRIKGFGILADNLTNLDILDNEIFNISSVNTHALHIEDGENITIKNNMFNATDVAMDEDAHNYKHWKAIMVNNDNLPVINSTRNLIIYNNTLIDHEWAMDLRGATNVNVSRNQINITQLYRAMAITLRYVREGVFDRNVQYRTIDDVWVIDTDGYVVDTGCRNIIISNGNITNVNVNGIIMLDMLQIDDYPQNVTIENMIIRNCVHMAKGIYFYGGGSDTGVYTENSSVIGNDVSLCECGINSGGLHGGALNSVFINNTVHDNYYGFSDGNGYYDRADNLFENNVVYDISITAFNIGGSMNYSFINNLIYDINGDGISVESNSNIIGNTIRNTSKAIFVDEGDNNNIRSNVLEGNDYNIYLDDSDNNSFYDMDATGSVVADIYADSSSSTNNYFINVSHDKSDVSVQNSANLSFKWYLDAHATDRSGDDLANVTITGWDTNNIQSFSNITEEDGNIERQTVDEYYQTQSGRTYFTDYTINASKTNYTTISRTEELTSNVLLDFSWVVSTPDDEDDNGGTFRPRTSLGELTTNLTIIIIEGNYRTFELNNTEYKITAKEIREDYAVFEIESNPQNISLGVGENKLVDLDRDGVNEIILNLTKIVYNTAYLRIELFEESIKEPLQIPLEEGLTNESSSDVNISEEKIMGEEKEIRNNKIIIFFAVVILLTIISIAIIYNKSHKV